VVKIEDPKNSPVLGCIICLNTVDSEFGYSNICINTINCDFGYANIWLNTFMDWPRVMRYSRGTRVTLAISM
jgi:hypothetical protein